MVIPGIGIAIIRDVRQQLRHNKVGLLRPIHLYHLAAAHARCGEYEIGFAFLDETIETVEALRSACSKQNCIGYAASWQTGRADRVRKS
jgi:hypothetical protein